MISLRLPAGFSINFARGTDSKLESHGFFDIAAYHHLGIDPFERDILITRDRQLLGHDLRIRHGKRTWST